MQPAASQIFISYRRADSTKDARALYERLRAAFGEDRVFMDFEGIAPGDDFVESLERQLAHCKVMVALIGPLWVGDRDAQGRRRLDDDRDLVRIEIRTALARGIKVLPVLVDGAPPLQAATLPADLQPLVRRQAIALDYTRFDADVDKLVEAIRHAIEPGAGPEPPQRTARWLRLTAAWPLAGAVAVFLAALGVGLALVPWPVGTGADDAQAPLPQAPKASQGGGDAPGTLAPQGDPRASPQALRLLQALRRAHITNSVGDAELLAWLDDADRHYLRLAEACLGLVGAAIVAGDGVDIDKVNEVYSRSIGLQGDEVMPPAHAVDLPKLQAALLEAYNNKNGTSWKAFAQILQR